MAVVKKQRQKQFLTEYSKAAIAKTKSDITFPITLYNLCKGRNINNLNISKITFLTESGNALSPTFLRDLGIFIDEIKESKEKREEFKKKNGLKKLFVLGVMFPLVYSLFDGVGTFLDGVYLDKLELISADSALISYELTFLAYGLITYFYVKKKDPKVKIFNGNIINFKNGNSKIIPNLIIDNNDVVANHSAYIGSFSEDDIFYIKSRGINEIDMYKLLYRSLLLGKMNLSEEEFSKEKNHLDETTKLLRDTISNLLRNSLKFIIDILYKPFYHQLLLQ